MLTNIFIAFAKEDFDVHDNLLRQMNLVKDIEDWNIWSSHEIKAGSSWDVEIKERIEKSEIFILLMSVSFFNSTYILDTELPLIIAKHQGGNCHIIPVIARNCHWKDSLFSRLGNIQALPSSERPLISRGFWENEEDPYVETVTGIKDSVRAFQNKQQDTKEQKAKPNGEAEENRIAQAQNESKVISSAGKSKSDVTPWHQVLWVRIVGLLTILGLVLAVLDSGSSVFDRFYKPTPKEILVSNAPIKIRYSKNSNVSIKARVPYLLQIQTYLVDNIISDSIIISDFKIQNDRIINTDSITNRSVQLYPGTGSFSSYSPGNGISSLHEIDFNLNIYLTLLPPAFVAKPGKLFELGYVTFSVPYWVHGKRKIKEQKVDVVLEAN